MPRTGRAHSGTGIYHVMLRGINRQDIFEEPEDYWAFIKILSSLRQRLEDEGTCACRIYAYCLMPNHVHLLLCEKDWKLGDVVKSVAASYAFFYNKKYGRIGHLFQDRFKSEPCNTPGYFITLFRYIHQNPVKAGLVQTAAEYGYSSWGNDYLNKAAIKVCHTEAVVNRFGKEELAAWVDMPLPESAECLELSERKIIADEDVRRLILEKSRACSVTDFQSLPKEWKKEVVNGVMKELGAGPRQMSRVSGLPYSLIYKLNKNSI